MAIRIIPTPPKRAPAWESILFYLSLILLMSIVGGFIILDKKIIPSQEQKLIELKGIIAKTKTPKEKALEKELKAYQKKIEDFSFLLSRHQKTSKIFSFFESTSHPKIWFASFNSDFRRHQATVSGFTESFKTLGQQLLVFKKHPSVEKVELTRISIGERGKIRFTFNLLFSPKIFK